GGGLVGDDVGFDAAAQQCGQDFGGVADDGHRVRAPLVLRGDRGADGRVEDVGDLVEVAVVQAAPGAVRVAFHQQCCPAVEGDRERLGAAHSAEFGADGEGAGEGAAEALVGDGGEGFVGSLQDSLGSDVDPGAGGH